MQRRIAASAHKGIFANAWRLGCFMVRGLFIHNGTYVLSDCSVRFVFNNLFHVLHRIICLGVCVYDCFSDNSSMAYRKCVCYDSIPVFRICFRKSKVENEILAELKTTKGWLIGMIMLASYISFVTVNENYPIDIHLHQYGLFVVFMVSALLGLVVIFCLSLFLERWSNVLVVRFLWYIGANTLVYYAFQSKVIAF